MPTPMREEVLPPRPGTLPGVTACSDTVEWRTPGGDFLGEASASETVSGMGRYTWGSTSQMVADVQGWLDDPSTNFGWLIMGNESEMKTSKRFDSKESSEEANRPSLTIEFKSPGNGQEADSNIYNY